MLFVRSVLVRCRPVEANYGHRQLLQLMNFELTVSSEQPRVWIVSTENRYLHLLEFAPIVRIFFSFRFTKSSLQTWFLSSSYFLLQRYSQSNVRYLNEPSIPLVIVDFSFTIPSMYFNSNCCCCYCFATWMPNRSMLFAINDKFSSIIGNLCNSTLIPKTSWSNSSSFSSNHLCAMANRFPGNYAWIPKRWNTRP